MALIGTCSNHWNLYVTLCDKRDLADVIKGFAMGIIQVGPIRLHQFLLSENFSELW